MQYKTQYVELWRFNLILDSIVGEVNYFLVAHVSSENKAYKCSYTNGKIIVTQHEYSSTEWQTITDVLETRDHRTVAVNMGKYDLFLYVVAERGLDLTQKVLNTLC